MAAGLPVVSKDGKGNRELINEGETVFMIWTNDVQQFINKLTFGVLP